MDKWWNKGQMQWRKTRFFSGQAKKGLNFWKVWKCHKLVTPGCSTLWNAALLPFCLCSLLQSVGGPCSDIHSSYISTSRWGPLLQATGFLFCPTPGILPCGDKIMWLHRILSRTHWAAPVHTSYISLKKCNYLRYIIHVQSCIYHPLCAHFVDKPFILTAGF